MIDLQRVSKEYPGRGGAVRALSDLSLQVEEGEFVAVRGPSGSGKSTLLLTIGGMIRPTSGSVTVRDQELYALSGPARARYRRYNVGFVFQMFHLVPYLSVVENVMLPGPPLLRPDSKGTRTRRLPVRGRALELLDRFGMASRQHHLPSELSTGERQRTAIARALINDPWLLLADEPTGNLDPDTGAQIMAYLADFHRSGRTVIVVTHEPVVEQQAQRTIHLRNGHAEPQEA